jgi:hypothetical protein
VWCADDDDDDDDNLAHGSVSHAYVTVLATSGIEDVREVLKTYDGKDVLATFAENQVRNEHLVVARVSSARTAPSCRGCCC